MLGVPFHLAIPGVSYILRSAFPSLQNTFALVYDTHIASRSKGCKLKGLFLPWGFNPNQKLMCYTYIFSLFVKTKGEFLNYVLFEK